MKPSTMSSRYPDVLTTSPVLFVLAPIRSLDEHVTSQNELTGWMLKAQPNLLHKASLSDFKFKSHIDRHPKWQEDLVLVLCHWAEDLSWLQELVIHRCFADVLTISQC